MNDEALKLDKQICFRLYKTSRRMTRLYQDILDPLGITYPQYITLLVLWEHECIDFKELGVSLDLKTGTITPILKRLELLGYIYREKNTEDNRRLWIKLTEKGRELKFVARKVPETLLKYIDLDQDKYIRYVNILDELGEILEKAEIKQKKEERK